VNDFLERFIYNNVQCRDMFTGLYTIPRLVPPPHDHTSVTFDKNDQSREKVELRLAHIYIPPTEETITKNNYSQACSHNI
jgi:hypothetical protein